MAAGAGCGRPFHVISTHGVLSLNISLRSLRSGGVPDCAGFAAPLVASPVIASTGYEYAALSVEF